MILKKISPDHSSPGASPSTYGQRRPLHTLEGKLTLAFLLATAAIFAVNLFLVLNINTALEKINRVFYSNVQTNTLSEALDNVQQGLADYLGVDRSALSNELSKLRREKLVYTEKNQFHLLKQEESL